MASGTLALWTDASSNLMFRAVSAFWCAPWRRGSEAGVDAACVALHPVTLAGLTRDEFRLHLMCVAREADRLEQMLTGEDRN